MHTENEVNSTPVQDPKVIRKTWSTPVIEVHNIEDLTLAAANANPDFGAGSS